MMLREMYYWLMYFLKKIGRTEMLEFNSYLLICMLLCFNIMTTFIIACFLLNIEPKLLITDYKITGIIFGLSIIIPLYFILFARRTQIVEKFDQLPKMRKIRGKIIFWIYSIVSIPLFFILVTQLKR